MLVSSEQKVIEIQNNSNQKALQAIATLFMTTYKFKKIHQISKFPEPKCVLGHSEHL